MKILALENKSLSIELNSRYFFLILLFVSVPNFASSADSKISTAVQPSLAPMIEQATPSVVNISSQGEVELKFNPLLNDPFFRRFFNFSYS